MYKKVINIVATVVDNAHWIIIYTYTLYASIIMGKLYKKQFIMVNVLKYRVHLQCMPFIKLCLGSIWMDPVIIELC